MKQCKFIQLLVLLVVFASPLAVNAGKYPQVLVDTVAAAKKATPVVTIDQFKAAIGNLDY